MIQFDIIVCFHQNSNVEQNQPGYLNKLWFMDGNNKKIQEPLFIRKNSNRILGFKINPKDNLFDLSDEVMEVIENSGYKKIGEFYSDDINYIGFCKN